MNAMARRRLVFFVGLALAAIAGMKLYVTGFYQDQLVWLLPLLGAGALVMWVSTKMPNEG